MNEKLKAARLSKGWSQEEAAAQAGVSFRAYWNWENGVANPNFGSRRVLRDAFGCADEELGFGKAHDEVSSPAIFGTGEILPALAFSDGSAIDWPTWSIIIWTSSQNEAFPRQRLISARIRANFMPNQVGQSIADPSEKANAGKISPVPKIAGEDTSSCAFPKPSSSSAHPNASRSTRLEPKFGLATPFSQFQYALKETPAWAAASSCDQPLLNLAAFNFSFIGSLSLYSNCKNYHPIIQDW